MNINRRNFLKKSAKAAAVTVFLAGSVKLDDLIAETKGAESANKFKKTINISDYPALNKVGGYAMISSNIIVIRSGKNSFTALNTICTHKKCDVEFNGSKFECPCHGSEFTKTGKVLNGPAKKNLKKYSTSFNAETGELTINM
jgi:cytochrome b6-f complex iron-sulfur subunit